MSDRKWNDRQREAIDARGKSVVVSAAAGSGKTSVLTERVLELIKSGCDVENMLIVTFTNLAAGEMKERIFARLHAASGDDLRLAVQAEKCAFADISTIHAFCGRVIRDNFDFAGVLPTVAIADDAQATQIRQRALDASVSEMIADQPDFAAKYAPGGDFDSIKGIVDAIYSRVASQRDSQQWLDDAERNFSSCGFAQTLYSEYERMVRSAAHRAAGHINERTDIWRLRGFDGEADASECARIEMMRAVHNMSMDDTALPIIAPISAKGAAGAPNRESTTLTGRANKCFDTLRGYERGFAAAVGAELEATADDGRMFLAMTRAFMKRYARAKRSKNLIDHDDTLHLALKVLSVPDIAERYRNRYAHVFVDEYQDINDVQNAIITCIQRGGNDFLVGDVKQCIYTFRESNPELLMRRCDELRRDGLVEMNTNYRSEPRIIDFINDVMHHMMSEDAGGVCYEGGHRLGNGRGGDGCVDIVMADPQGADKLEAEGAAIGRYIEVLIEQGYTYKDIAVLRPEMGTTGKQLTRILEQMDIPVISGAKAAGEANSEAAVFINLLKLIDRPVSDVALLSVMRYPHFGFTEPELAQIRIAQSKDEAKKDRSFYHAAQMMKEDSALGRKLKAFWDEIDGYRRLADALPVADFLMRLRRDAAFREYALTSPDAARSDNALAAFITAASAVDAPSLGDVLDIALSEDYGSASTIGPGEMDAVYLTTIHKSKGLEFPAVILSGMHKQIFKRDAAGSVLVGRSLGLALDVRDAATHTQCTTLHKIAVSQRIRREKISETVRLLYVGMTRAIRHLAIIGAGEGIDEKWCKDAVPGWQHTAVTHFDLIMPAVYMMCRQSGADIEERVRIVQETPVSRTAGDRAQRLNELFEQAVASPPADIFTEYEYKDDLGVPSKLSVSALKRRSETQTFAPVHVPSPDGDISAAQRGTLMHKVLQKIGLEPKSEDEVRQCAADMARRGVIGDGDAAHVDAGAVAQFLASDIAARARRAQRCFVEAPFCLGMSASEVKVAESDARIIVQGVIDLCFLEDDNWVIVDYKTDRIDAASANDAAGKYAVQLGLYAKALHRITGKEVKQKVIYFLETGQAVFVP